MNESKKESMNTDKTVLSQYIYFFISTDLQIVKTSPYYYLIL